MVLSIKRTLLPLVTALLFACGEQAEVVDLGRIEMPADHAAAPAKAEPQGPRQVVVPAELQGKFTTATMELQLPGSDQAITLELPLNGGVQQTDYGTLQVRDYLPAFLISGNTITSEGAEEMNPALWAEWQRNGETVFSGWLFRNYPTLNPMLLPDHQLTFIGIR